MSVTVPDTSLEFLPLFPLETEETILGRLIDWANETLDPVVDSDQWVDTREGGHWRTCIVPVVREMARLYDLAGTEVPASGFVLWSWEVYLDDLAAVYDVFRLPATVSMGSVVFVGTPGTEIDAGLTISANPSTPDDPAPLFEVPSGGVIGGGGTVELAVQAREAGKFGDVGANALTIPSSPLPPSGVTSFTNPNPTFGGTDVETDDRLRQRVLDALAGKGPGTVADYVRWAGAWPGVGHVSVIPVWNGANTVLVMIADPDGQPLPTAVVTALGQDLDPVAGKGHGTAPVGATVTVETSTILPVTIDVTGITYEPGYSWAGAGGGIAVGPGIQAALVRYFLSVPPGGEVVRRHVEGLFATWPGVHDVPDALLNGLTANVPVALTPPQVPTVQAIVGV